MPDLSWDKTYTLDDLRRWSRSAPSLAVVGQPIEHSRSPLMHNAALNSVAGSVAGSTAGSGSLRYFRFEIAPEALPEALPLFAAKNFIGLNLTLPHKVLALPLLAGNALSAEVAGAANTLLRTAGRIAGDGYIGHNTDGAGFLRALETEFGLTSAAFNANTGTHTLFILGAGGAARGIAAAALTAEPSAKITLANRSPDRLNETVAALKASFPTASISTAAPRAPLPAVVVNATSLGLRAGDPSPLPSEFWKTAGKHIYAYDIVCGVPETAFLHDARAAGVPAADGFAMLAHQGALALEIWTGLPAGDTAPVMLRALRS